MRLLETVFHEDMTSLPITVNELEARRQNALTSVSILACYVIAGVK